MRISLVCPTNDYGESSSKGIYYPMGILLVGSLVKDTFPDWDVGVYDGGVYQESELEMLVRGSDVLGLSANTNNYQHCVNLANFAKSHGTGLVVVGGPHASAILRHEDKQISMSELIIRNQPNIDAVITNDGEHAFLKLLTELQKKSPDLAKIDKLMPFGQLR